MKPHLCDLFNAREYIRPLKAGSERMQDGELEGAGVERRDDARAEVGEGCGGDASG
jgi:hypothetical protein